MTAILVTSGFCAVVLLNGFLFSRVLAASPEKTTTPSPASGAINITGQPRYLSREKAAALVIDAFKQFGQDISQMQHFNWYTDHSMPGPDVQDMLETLPPVWNFLFYDGALEPTQAQVCYYAAVYADTGEFVTLIRGRPFDRLDQILSAYGDSTTVYMCSNFSIPMPTPDEEYLPVTGEIHRLVGEGKDIKWTDATTGKSIDKDPHIGNTNENRLNEIVNNMQKNKLQ